MPLCNSSESADTEIKDNENDRKVVEDELVSYESAGELCGEDLEDFDIIRFWQV